MVWGRSSIRWTFELARPPLSLPSLGDPNLPSPSLALIRSLHQLFNASGCFGVSPGPAFGSVLFDRVAHAELVEFRNSTVGLGAESKNTSSPMKSTFC